MPLHRLLIAALSCAVLSNAPLSAQQAADNVLVATSVNTFPTSYRIREYTAAGALVQELPVPHPSGAHPPTERLRDVAVHPSGDLYAFNGTFSPYLSVRRAATGQWEHYSHPLWSTSNSGSYGGVALYEHAVFVTIGQTAFVNGGLLRFELPSFTPTVFATQFVQGFVDVTVGWDGLLYAVSTTGDDVEVFDPETLAHVRTIQLPAFLDARGIGVDRHGDLFVATWQSGVRHFDRDGNLLAVLTTGSRHHDLDLDACGTILFGDWQGAAFRTDTSLGGVQSFVGGQFNTFVAFRSPNVPAPARQVVRNGTPPNPESFQPGNAPLLGQVWQPTLAPFLPGAFADAMVVAAAPADFPSPIGTWLFAPQHPYFVIAVPAGAPLQLPIPAHCALTGVVFHAQAISVSVATCTFANALDVRIGGF